MGINVTESYYPNAQQRPYAPPRPDAANYGSWQQTYYGASREERAQRERDYYRRVQMEMEQEWNDKSKKTVNETIFNSFLVVFTVLAAGLAYAYFDSLAQRNMARRELNRSERIYFNEGGSYPRPLRRNGHGYGGSQSSSSDMEEKEIRS